MESDELDLSGDLIQIDDDAAPVLVTDEMGRLRYRDQQVALTRLDRSYVGAAAVAARNERDIALIYPSPPTHIQLSVLLAVGYQSYSDPPTLFVSNRSGAGIRQQYFDVGIGEPHPGAPVQSLADITAPLVKTGDGKKLSHVTHHKPRNWEGNYRGVSVVHSTLGKKIAGSFPSGDDLPLSAIVLDLTTKLLDDFTVIEQYQRHAADRNIPILYLFDIPCHKHLDRLESQNLERSEENQTLFWGFAPSTLKKIGPSILDVEAKRTEFDPGSLTSETIDSDSPFEASIPVLRNIINGVNRDITELTYADLEPAATDAYNKIQKVASYVQHRKGSVPRSVGSAMRDLYFTHMYLSTLPTSVEFHDDIMAFDTGWGAGSTLDQMIDNVRNNYQALENDVTGAGNMLEDACDALSKMRSQLVERNPKADQTISEIRSAIDSDESLIVLTTTNRETSLLRSFVTEQAGIRGGSLDDAGVQFHSLYNTHTIPSADRLLFPGVPSKSHRPAVMSGIAPEQTYLTYEWETERLKYWLDHLEALAEHRCGPGALQHTINQLNIQHDGLSAVLGPSDRTQAPTPITDTDNKESQSQEAESGEDDTDQQRVPTTRKRGVGGRKSQSIGSSDSAVEKSQEIDPDSFTPDSNALANAAEYFDDGSEQESVNEGREHEGNTSVGAVEAIKISLSENSYIFERPQGLLWVYDDSSDRKNRHRKAANALQQGDTILITEQESRRDIFEHIVEKIRSEVPEFKKYSTMLDYWRTNLERILAQEEVTPKKMATALQEYAESNDIPKVSRQYHAVKAWQDKEAIGPSDHEVIHALGEIYDIDIYKEMSREIDASLDEIRTLHRQVGRHLDKILFSAGSADDSDTWLFEEFGLRVGDVQDAVEYRLVEDVSDEIHEVDQRDLGRLFEE